MKTIGSIGISDHNLLHSKVEKPTTGQYAKEYAQNAIRSLQMEDQVQDCDPLQDLVEMLKRASNRSKNEQSNDGQSNPDQMDQNAESEEEMEQFGQERRDIEKEKEEEEEDEESEEREERGDEDEETRQEKERQEEERQDGRHVESDEEENFIRRMKNLKISNRQNHPPNPHHHPLPSTPARDLPTPSIPSKQILPVPSTPSKEIMSNPRNPPTIPLLPSTPSIPSKSKDSTSTPSRDLPSIPSLQTTPARDPPVPSKTRIPASPAITSNETMPNNNSSSLTSKKQLISDLIHFFPKDSSRRARKKWSAEEVAMLEDGVKRFGVGKWVQICKEYDFGDRIPQDLKDKWRNLQK